MTNDHGTPQWQPDPSPAADLHVTVWARDLYTLLYADDMNGPLVLAAAARLETQLRQAIADA